MFTLEIKTDNAAFTDYREGEIARILSNLGENLEEVNLNPDGDSGVLVDANGNRVGEWTYST